MLTILAAFTKAVLQLPEAEFRRVLLRGIGLALALLIGASISVFWMIQLLASGSDMFPWLASLASWGGALLMVVLMGFLMIPVASAITSFYLDDVAHAVEAKHYPTLTPAPSLPFREILRDTVGFLGIIIGLNLVALIFYPFMGPLAVPAYFALNGYLLGREYFQMAAMRRIGRAAAVQLRRKHSGLIWLAGCLMALPLSLPLVNLIIPILGAATFTHLFHKLDSPNSR
jgi:uncharacterized protein involved in cysteine biosynthesis